MRAALALLVSLAISTPALAQVKADDQDHSAHHPPAADGAPARTVGPSSSGPQLPSAGAMNAASGRAGECSMMPDMMQSMMKGMMQGMMGSGQGMMGSGQGPSMQPGMPGMGAKPGETMGRQGAAASPTGTDLSLAAITQRALVERARNALSGPSQAGDAEFARVAVVLQEALVDAAKATAAFGNLPETRQRAQALVAANEAELAALRSWAASLK